MTTNAGAGDEWCRSASVQRSNAGKGKEAIEKMFSPDFATALTR
jgi:hypothetical protein